MKNLKFLIKEGEVKSGVRIWGVIYGTEANYIIIESTTDQTAEKQEGEPNPEVEAKGAGTNVYSYWVTSKPDGKYILLPEVTPQ